MMDWVDMDLGLSWHGLQMKLTWIMNWGKKWSGGGVNSTHTCLTRSLRNFRACWFWWWKPGWQEPRCQCQCKLEIYCRRQTPWIKLIEFKRKILLFWYMTQTYDKILLIPLLPFFTQTLQESGIYNLPWSIIINQTLSLKVSATGLADWEVVFVQDTKWNPRRKPDTEHLSLAI